MHASRHTDATEGLAPRDGFRLVAGGRRKGVRRAGAPADKAVNRFLDIDKWLFHGTKRISQAVSRRKPIRGKAEIVKTELDSKSTELLKTAFACRCPPLIWRHDSGGRRQI